jgi:hypothetical protein
MRILINWIMSMFADRDYGRVEDDLLQGLHHNAVQKDAIYRKRIREELERCGAR